MKKFCCCIALMATAFLSVNAQDGERIFKRFKGDVSLGYAAPLGSNSNGGVLFAMEPKFAVMDKLAVGLRIEAAVMAKFSGGFTNYGNAEIQNARGTASYLATADYYFTNNYSIRPFIGAGAGIYGIVIDATDTNDEVSEAKFGGIIRAGAEVKHLRFGIEFNMIPSSQANAYTFDDQGNYLPTRVSLKNSYIGIKLGVCFGGGPLNR